MSAAESLIGSALRAHGEAPERESPAAGGLIYREVKKDEGLMLTRSTPELDLVIRPYQPADEAAVIDLWQRCALVVPWNDPQRDIALKLQAQPYLFLVGTLAERVVATVMVGYDGHRGFINYRAVSPDCQRRGIGRRLMEAAEAELRKLGCPKINLMVRTSNKTVIAFYERLGFTLDAVVCMGKRLH
jgi:ribosomal protein S18 acetylase RimI-like enzyme